MQKSLYVNCKEIEEIRTRYAGGISKNATPNITSYIELSNKIYLEKRSRIECEINNLNNIYTNKIIMVGASYKYIDNLFKLVVPHVVSTIVIYNYNQDFKKHSLQNTMISKKSHAPHSECGNKQHSLPGKSILYNYFIQFEKEIFVQNSEINLGRYLVLDDPQIQGGLKLYYEAYIRQSINKNTVTGIEIEGNCGINLAEANKSSQYTKAQLIVNGPNLDGKLNIGGNIKSTNFKLTGESKLMLQLASIRGSIKTNPITFAGQTMQSKLSVNTGVGIGFSLGGSLIVEPKEQKYDLQLTAGFGVGYVAEVKLNISG